MSSSYKIADFGTLLGWAGAIGLLIAGMWPLSLLAVGFAFFCGWIKWRRRIEIEGSEGAAWDSIKQGRRPMGE